MEHELEYAYGQAPVLAGGEMILWKGKPQKKGFIATKSAWELAGKLNVDMPIIQAAHAVLYEGKEAAQVVAALLQRSKKPESEDSGWQ